MFIIDNEKRSRRNIGLSNLKLNKQPEEYIAGNWTENVTQIIPVGESSPTLNDEDVNITMHCDSYWLSCRGRCTRERELGGTEERLQCFCDSSCGMFQDCCADFDQFCSSSTSPQKTTKPDLHFTSELWRCVEIHWLAEARGMWMISACPRNWTEESIEERCLNSAITSYDNYKDSLPVIDRKGNTYKNHYCAQCHGSNLLYLTFYNLKFNCDVPAPKGIQSNQLLKFLFTFCENVFWQPPEGVARRYCHRLWPRNDFLESSLPETLHQKCLNGSSRLVYASETLLHQDSANFFNPYCAFLSDAKQIRCGPGSSKPLDDAGTLPKPFSLVMDLGFSNNQQSEDTSNVRSFKVSCPEGYVYDFHLQVCRPGITQFDFNSPRSKTFSICVWIRSNMSSFWNPLITETNFKDALSDKLNISETQFSDIVIVNPSGPIATVVFYINVSRTLQKSVSIDILKTAISSSSIALRDASFTVFKVSVKPFNCAIIETFYPHEYTVEGNAVKITNTTEMFQEADFYTNETQWLNGSLIPVGVLTVCKEPRLNCSGILVEFNDNEYATLPNGSLYRNTSGEVFETGTFKFINDSVWVCTQFSSVYKIVGRRTVVNDILLVLLTYVGLFVSILGLILVLVTYSLFKELRTLPGINLINLSLSLLLADSLFLGTALVEAKFACAIIAILLHYLFLVSFTWMSIIAIETWKAFSKIRVQHVHPNRREKCLNLLRRITLGWLPAFVFTVVCVALDQSNVVAFHYGGIKGCWINSSSANLVFFILPVALCISVNIVFFALTVRAITKTNKETRRATYHTNNRITAIVFLKIFILMGFTWIFGFMKDLVSRYFEYPFIIFTTLQGLYVALAFVCTKKVKKMYCTLLCLEKDSTDRNKHSLRIKRELPPPVVLPSHAAKTEAKTD